MTQPVEVTEPLASDRAHQPPGASVYRLQPKGCHMKRTLATKLTLATAAAALALGGAACEVEEGDVDPVEDPMIEEEGDL